MNHSLIPFILDVPWEGCQNKINNLHELLLRIVYKGNISSLEDLLNSFMILSNQWTGFYMITDPVMKE